MNQTPTQNRPTPEQAPPRSHKGLILLAIAVVVLLAAWGILSRWHASSKLHEETEESAVPAVSVLKAATGPVEEEVVLPGNVQAWHESAIYARTSGYVKDWKTDIGAHVAQGQVLAEIETPEVDAQLHQAQADLATAEANSQLAQTTARRWLALLKTNSVSRQETDEKVSDAKAKAAQAASARANVDRLRQLEGFKRVVAPFAGTVTVRNTDTGALINAGSGAGSELFHVAQMDRLRVYTQVPENYTGAISSGTLAELHFPAHPGRSFLGRLVDTAHAIDPAARTLLVQFGVDNAQGELMPGGYVEVHIKMPGRAKSVRLPASALLFRAQGIQAVTVDADGKAQLKGLKMGRDFGKEVEVLAGIASGDTVVVNPPDSIAQDEKVRVLSPEEEKQKGGAGESQSDKTNDKKSADSSDKSEGKSAKQPGVSKDGISVDKKTGEIKNNGTGNRQGGGKSDDKGGQSDAKKLGTTDSKAETADDSGRLTAKPGSPNGENPNAGKDGAGKDGADKKDKQ